jgi:hypothetical protein
LIFPFWHWIHRCGNHIDFSFLALDSLLLSSASTLIEPLQDRPQTASVLRLLQRANRLWCNTVTGGLHRPLGKWLVPGPQLWRVWPFYFDPDTQTLWSKTGEGFNVHSCNLFGCGQRTTQFHLQTNQHETTLPSNSFPVECQEATDRSVKPYRAQGTFAWVLADQDGNPWLRCRGPVSGTPIDSFRFEAHVVRTSVSEFVGGPFYGYYFHHQDLYIYR